MKHFVPRIEQTTHHRKQPALGPVSRDHLVRIEGETSTGMDLNDSTAKPGLSGNGRVRKRVFRHATEAFEKDFRGLNHGIPTNHSYVGSA